MIAKIATSFSSYTDSGIAEKAQHIVNSLTGNVAYPAPVPALTDVQTAITSFTESLANLGTNGKQGTLLKNQLRDTLQQLLNSLALYVQATGGSDIVVLQGSGYDLQKGKGSPIGILPKPSNFKVVPGPVAGSVKVSFDAIPGANTYLFQYAEVVANGDSYAWKNVYSGKSSSLIEGLTSGTQYAFRVCAIGTDPTLVYSDVISTFVI
jgi:hypothetical protein